MLLQSVVSILHSHHGNRGLVSTRPISFLIGRVADRDAGNASFLAR
jgi:hypothetical protein